jgi:hypothetical protein
VVLEEAIVAMISMLFPAGVFGLALTMLVAHGRSWRRARTQPLNDSDRSFREGQFRRRMQASSLLALVAPTMLLGLRISPERSPKVFVALWLMVLVTTCWVAWLAILDAVASSLHFRRLSSERATTRARLKAELDRILADAQARRAVTESTAAEDTAGPTRN